MVAPHALFQCRVVYRGGAEDFEDPVGFGNQVKGVKDLFQGFQDGEGRYRADYYGYADANDFAHHLEQDLKSFIKRQRSSGAEPSQTEEKPKPAETERVPAAYLQRLKQMSRASSYWAWISRKALPMVCRRSTCRQ